MSEKIPVSLLQVFYDIKCLFYSQSKVMPCSDGL